jgi:hypothetical protein
LLPSSARLVNARLCFGANWLKVDQKYCVCEEREREREREKERESERECV